MSNATTNDGRLTTFIRRWSYPAAIVLALFVFFQSAELHSGISLWDWLFHGAKIKPTELFLFFSPCLIFAITTAVYFEFITNYTGEIAGLSVLGLLAALACCVKLSEAKASDWAVHLRWMYVLFYSYVVWDYAILIACSPSDEHKNEITALSIHINQPTLVAIFIMWVAAQHVEPEIAANYVSGVVAFHLVFATLACVRTIMFYRFKV